MSKGKGMKKSQIALAVMVVALGAAVWLNMRYAGSVADKTAETSSKYLGEAEYVGGVIEGTAIETSAKPDTSAAQAESAYFSRLRRERNTARNDAIALLEETLANDKLSTEEKQSVADSAAKLAMRSEQEAAIETLLKAKGFASVLAVMGDKDINIIVQSDGLIPAQTTQIQDAVTAQTEFSVAQIKIVSMSEEEIKNASK